MKTSETNFKNWIKASRLRTLPLAFSSITTGAAIAVQQGQFKLNIFILSILTTIFLQILSNFSNDYGDAKSGKDDKRIGEQRMVASGLIKAEKMKKAMIVFAFLSLISGLVLIYKSFENFSFIIGFLVLGLFAIWAAIRYTVGKKPYGYSGYGDIFVFVFFGLVGVMGSTFLFTKSFDWISVFPAIAIGGLATAVLTLNNLRDIENDSKTGKNTMIVKMGFVNGKIYFAVTILISILSMITYAVFTHFENRQYIFLLSAILLSGILKKVLSTNKPAEMDPFLKKTALATFLMAVLFIISVSFI